MGYLRPHQEEFNYLRHLILMYGHDSESWSENDLRFYVTHINRDGSADDWFYDSFLFLNSKAPSGADFQADINLGTTMNGEGDFYAICSPNPARIDDWKDLIELYLGENGYLDRLESTVRWASGTLGHKPPFRRNVVLAIPYPHITQARFGRLPAEPKNLNFSVLKQSLMDATKNRLQATRWFVQECIRRFDAKGYEHLHLLGFYWMHETLYRAWDVDDHYLLKELRKVVNKAQRKMFWIPFFSTYNFHLLDDYQSYYFDAAFLQPNYMFYKGGDDNLMRAAAEASKRNAGIELEYFLQLDEPIQTVSDRKQRFRNYLNKGIELGYMSESACAHFQGMNALPQIYRHRDPTERQFYDDIYAFVKGTYTYKEDILQEHEADTEVVIAVDLGGTNVRTALIDRSGEVLYKVQEPVSAEGEAGEVTELRIQDHWHPIPESAQRILGKIRKLIMQTKARADEDHLHVAGIGISTGGRVDWENGVVLDSTALLSGWENVPVRRYLEQEFGVPVRIDNDGHCSALAIKEYVNSWRGKTILSLTIGTGIGGGLLIGGSLYRGARNAAGELGHMCIDPDGPVCSCGAHGCLEVYASGSGLQRLAKSAQLNCQNGEITAEIIGKKVAEGDKVAEKIVQEGGKMLGAGLASLTNILNPDTIVISGPVLHVGPLFIETAESEFRQRVMRVQGSDVELVFLKCVKDLGLKGAAKLIFENRDNPKV